jgi:hypothetical protein
MQDYSALLCDDCQSEDSAVTLVSHNPIRHTKKSFPS